MPMNNINQKKIPNNWKRKTISHSKNHIAYGASQDLLLKSVIIIIPLWSHQRQNRCRKGLQSQRADTSLLTTYFFENSTKEQLETSFREFYLFPEQIFNFI